MGVAIFSQKARGLAVSPSLVLAIIVLVFWIVVAIFWRWLVPYDPQALNPVTTLQPPSLAHWLGTDDLGRDVFSRMLAGSTSVLLVAPAATALAIAGGLLTGLVSGYFGGLTDMLVMRVVDALLAFPVLVIAVLVLAVLGGSAANVAIVIGIVFTPLIGRTVRAAVLTERKCDYVAAARMRGESKAYIMLFEILPNILAPLTVEGTTRLGLAIFTSATLSFLALGVQQPSPDWGLSISLGRSFLQVAPWIVLAPAAAVISLVLAVNVVADALRARLEL